MPGSGRGAFPGWRSAFPGLPVLLPGTMLAPTSPRGGSGASPSATPPRQPGTPRPSALPAWTRGAGARREDAREGPGLRAPAPRPGRLPRTGARSCSSPGRLGSGSAGETPSRAAEPGAGVGGPVLRRALEPARGTSPGRGRCPQAAAGLRRRRMARGRRVCVCVSPRSLVTGAAAPAPPAAAFLATAPLAEPMALGAASRARLPALQLAGAEQRLHRPPPRPARAPSASLKCPRRSGRTRLHVGSQRPTSNLPGGWHRPSSGGEERGGEVSPFPRTESPLRLYYLSLTLGALCAAIKQLQAGRDFPR